MASQVEEWAELREDGQRQEQAAARSPGFPRAVGIHRRAFDVRMTCSDLRFAHCSLAAVCKMDFCRVVKGKTWLNAIASTL